HWSGSVAVTCARCAPGELSEGSPKASSSAFTVAELVHHGHEGLVHNAVRTVRGVASCQAAGEAPGMRCSWDPLPDGRSHSDAWVGCMVWSTTASSSAVRVLRSTWSRRLAPN